MVMRCTNPSVGEKTFALYGGRGIKVCDRWRTFANFFADMGTAEDGMTLDRINSDGDYEPSNCRWATMKEQQNNRCNTRHLTVNGETKTVGQWADVSGLKTSQINARLAKGWTAERALSTPIRFKRPHGATFNNYS
jgi:hypothetical protein